MVTQRRGQLSRLLQEAAALTGATREGPAAVLGGTTAPRASVQVTGTEPQGVGLKVWVFAEVSIEYHERGARNDFDLLDAAESGLSKLLIDLTRRGYWVLPDSGRLTDLDQENNDRIMTAAVTVGLTVPEEE